MTLNVKQIAHCIGSIKMTAEGIKIDLIIRCVYNSKLNDLKELIVACNAV